MWKLLVVVAVMLIVGKFYEIPVNWQFLPKPVPPFCL
ncbi:hypothetical protein SLEP1_g34242 [Rubroshorea leprosula]|uniref:Uncharacterized protein n=1 Tax=Rubroshorea leprosula TaxID=152421 RepID=A0AAV5KJ99_9ROSI|nr:hypothetical protein SLEP1_g34242 [Rubroshorea leprosula]